MNFSNKQLLSVIIAATLLSLFSSLAIIGYLHVLNVEKSSFSTGFATSGRANVSIYIAPSLSITTFDGSNISFNGCSPGHVIFSNESDGNSFSDCPGFVPHNIILRNDGSFPSNITVESTNMGEAHGGSFINSSSNSSWISYKISNSSSMGNYSGGCLLGIIDSWTNFTSNGTLFQACDYLASNMFNNSFSFDVAIFIPNSTVPSDNNISFTFWGSSV